MTTLLLIILLCLVGGVLSAACAATFMLAPEAWRVRILPHLLSFAVGTMLGAAFLALLPHAILDGHIEDVHWLGVTVLGGVLFFFLLEKLILWRHHHVQTHRPGGERAPEGYLILFGDALHNFIDGIVIAGAFLTDAHLGVVTALAVAAHEIPQEVGDLAVLLASGFSRARALAYNLAASAATVVGGVVAYFALSSLLGWIPYVLSLAAASFIYIALADLIPILHRRTRPADGLRQLVLIALGATMIHYLHAMAH